MHPFSRLNSFCSRLIIIPAMLFAVNASAQGDTAYVYSPARIAERITADGKLDEAAWSAAVTLDGFMQTDPVPGGAPSYASSVRLMYDDDYLYIGMVMLDPDPSKMIATAMERDSDVEEDDAVSIIIDSYNDNLNGIGFATNPLGIRFDFEISQNGQNINESFNTFWNVGCATAADGWTAEFIIPFSSLRFQQKEQVIMGFKAIRLLKRSNEYSVFPPHKSDIADPHFRLDLTTHISFANLKSKKPLYVAPYIAGDISQDKIYDPASNKFVQQINVLSRNYYVKDEVHDRLFSNIGLDVKAGLSKNFTLDLTLNTDFAQAEVDDRILNITRYNVFLPEKRGFFLEAQDYFNFNMGVTRVFNSRSIGIENGSMVPIIGGARITGQASGYQLGLMNMQTHGVTEQGISPQNFSVFRMKKDLFGNGSYIGGIVTNRTSTGDRSVSNQVAGVDYLHRLGRKWFMTASLAGSTDSNTDEKEGITNLGSQFSISKKANQGFGHRLEVSYAGADFNPAMGFLRYQNLIWTANNNSYTWLLQEHKHIAFVAIENGALWGYNPLGEFTEFLNLSVAPVMIMKNGATFKAMPIDYYRDNFGFSWMLSDEITIPAGDYHQYSSNIYASSPENNQYYGEVYLKYGDFYGGTISSLYAGAYYNISKHIKTGGDYEYNHILFPDSFAIPGESPLYTASLASMNVELNFSAKASIKALIQYDDYSDTFGSNFRFRYNPREGTDLYIVLNQGVNTIRTPYFQGLPQRPVIQRQVLLVKFVRTFDAKSRN